MIHFHSSISRNKIYIENKEPNRRRAGKGPMLYPFVAYIRTIYSHMEHLFKRTRKEATEETDEWVRGNGGVTIISIIFRRRLPNGAVVNRTDQIPFKYTYLISGHNTSRIHQETIHLASTLR